jgi:hypothetical protein
MPTPRLSPTSAMPDPGYTTGPKVPVCTAPRPAVALGAGASSAAFGTSALARLNGLTSPGEKRPYSTPRAVSVLATWPRATSPRSATETLPLGCPVRSATSPAVARTRARTAASTTASRSFVWPSVPFGDAGAFVTVAAGGAEVLSVVTSGQARATGFSPVVGAASPVPGDALLARPFGARPEDAAVRVFAGPASLAAVSGPFAGAGTLGAAVARGAALVSVIDAVVSR